MSSAGWPSRYPLLQAPNAPAVVAHGLRLVSAVTDGRVSAGARVGSSVALSYWAYLELADGANATRRVLGAVVLGSVAVRAGRWLGGER